MSLPVERVDTREKPGSRETMIWNVDVDILSGQNHVVKRLFHSAGLAVKTLRRLAVGPLSGKSNLILGSLKIYFFPSFLDKPAISLSR
jgi:16S rRNA U516 pseudouridylate synthase RsuA-like enzyme